LRVAFLVANYAPSVGGAQLHVRRIAEGLVDRHGVDVEVVTTDALRAPAGTDPGRIDVAEESIGGVHVRREPPARRTHRALRDLRRAGRRLHVYRPGANTLFVAGPLGRRYGLAALDAARRCDVVVGVGAPSATLWWADVLGRRTDSAAVAMPLLHISDEPQRPWVLRCLRRADGVSISTPFERSWLEGRGVDPARMRVLPPGCDPEAYADVEPTAARARLGITEAPTVGYLGRMAAHKGVDTLVDAMRAVWVDRPEVRLVLAGGRTGWDLGAVLDRLDADERARVDVRESVDDDDKPWLLAACDVVAFPSRSESFGMVTVEAWCARRPVVAGDIGAVRSLVHPGLDAELVEPGDALGLAGHLSSLLEDPARRRALGAAGRRRAEQEFAWDPIVDGWHSFLAETIGRRRRHGRVSAAPATTGGR
jgi:glycosyltransferase involved in cell wall biosynthesis